MRQIDETACGVRKSTIVQLKYGVLTVYHIRHITSSSSWRPASAGSACVGEHVSGGNFPGKLPSAPAGGILLGKKGLDHGVGHPLLLLYDVKAPHGQNGNEFKALCHYLSASL